MSVKHTVVRMFYEVYDFWPWLHWHLKAGLETVVDTLDTLDTGAGWKRTYQWIVVENDVKRVYTTVPGHALDVAGQRGQDDGRAVSRRWGWCWYRIQCELKYLKLSF